MILPNFGFLRSVLMLRKIVRIGVVATVAVMLGCGSGSEKGGVEPKAPADAPKLEPKGVSGGPGAPKMKSE